eukprot:4790026-Pleurochrysis_carterae.AAC.1
MGRTLSEFLMDINFTYFVNHPGTSASHLSVEAISVSLVRTRKLNHGPCTTEDRAMNYEWKVHSSSE